MAAIQPTDSIIGPSRGEPGNWKTNDPVVREWIEHVYDINAADNMPDAAIVVAQAFLETGNFTNRWWKERLNAGSLGVTGDATENEASPTFRTTRESARAMSAHDLLYATGQINVGGLSPSDDPRYQAYRDYYGTQSFPQLYELAGRYATDPEYAIKIAQRAAQMYSGELTIKDNPMTIEFGRVPYPDVIPSHFSPNNPYIKRGAPVVPDAVVWHRMIGTWNGTDSWGHSGNFATAYGVSVRATDGTGGKIYEWIAPDSGLYGESSGPVNEPYGDGLALVNKVGVARVNQVSKAIEISGNYDTPLDNDAKQAVAELTAYFADQHHIPWNEFPIVPGEDRSFVIWHQELTIGTGKVCPGQVVMDATPEMIEMTKQFMREYQETTPEPPKPTAPKPRAVPQEVLDGNDYLDAKGTAWRAINRIVHVDPGTKFYCYGSTNAPESRTPAGPDGMDVRIAARVNSWYVTPRGSTFKVSQSDIDVKFKDL